MIRVEIVGQSSHYYEGFFISESKQRFLQVSIEIHRLFLQWYVLPFKYIKFLPRSLCNKLTKKESFTGVQLKFIGKFVQRKNVIRHSYWGVTSCR